MRWFLVLLLTGCSTTYMQPGKSEGDFQRDLYECEKDFAAMADRWVARHQVDRCLKVKGWRPQ